MLANAELEKKYASLAPVARNRKVWVVEDNATAVNCLQVALAKSVRPFLIQ